jgi:hypothetical protein
MATIVLQAVGSAVGGPIGAVIGSTVGQAIDASLFGPKPRQGPRLGELAVQTSSYGTAIPKLFGTMRVAGTVIWSTDLKERRSTSGGGKGQPKSVDYSYSASFAVALSGRPIVAVRRIWADGKLLRGAAGDFKSPTKFRLYRGEEDQPVDPLIAAAEGQGNSPAYRGTGYAMFEDLELADFGNRIPSLTFEVVADAGTVVIGDLAQELSAGAVAAGETPSVGGYAASGDSVRAAIEALSDVVPLSLIDDGERLVMTTTEGAGLELGSAELGAGGKRSEFVRRPAGSIAGEVTIAYYEPARDYQTGLQRASRGGPMQRTYRRALPAAIGSDVAKSFAEHRLATLWAARVGGTIRLHWRRSALRPGALVRIEGEPGLWRIARWTLQHMVVELELARVPGGMPIAASEPGRPVAEPDLRHGPTSVMLLDLPLYRDDAPERPQLFVAAAGAESGWRRADLLVSYDGGASWTAAGSTAAPAVMGTAVDMLAPGGSALFDDRASLEVELLNEAMWLEGRSDDALVGGANLALIGSELVQFGQVEPIGAGRFRLSRLLRGRMGTEHAATMHQAGEPFLLIERDALAVIEPPAGVVGGAVRLLALGREDEDGAAADLILAGEAQRPPAPVHLRAERRASGDLALSWVRRSRRGWSWLSGSDTPLGEEREAYRLEIAGGGFTRTLETGTADYLYSLAEQVADGASGAVEVLVVQLGTHGPSRPAMMTIQI